MKLTTNSTLILVGVIALAIIACFPITLFAMPLFKAQQPGQSDTFATVQAMVTQTVVALTQNAPTQTPISPTAIPLPSTATSVPATNTPLPTATIVSYCDWVTFVKDVTIPDGTQFSPGDTFTKIWRLKNRGTCTWTPDYMLVFVGGEQMGDTSAVRLSSYVSPGQSVDVSVTLNAPIIQGPYVGY